MGRTLILNLPGAGKDHCIEEHLDKGSCPWLRTRKFGQVWYCHLFHYMEQLDDDKGNGEGRLLRWPECKARDKEVQCED